MINGGNIVSFKANITLAMRQLDNKNFNIIETAPDIDDVVLYQLTETNRETALDFLTIIAGQNHGDEYSGYGYSAVDPGKNLNPMPLPLSQQNQNHDDGRGRLHLRKH
jgi:hypothetical protein